MKLFRTLILRPLRRDRLRTALTVLAVALGVARHSENAVSSPCFLRRFA